MENEDRFKEIEKTLIEVSTRIKTLEDTLDTSIKSLTGSLENDINDLSEELKKTKEVVKMIHKKTKIKTYAGMVNLKPEDIFLKKD